MQNPFVPRFGNVRIVAFVVGMLVALSGSGVAVAQKTGGAPLPSGDMLGFTQKGRPVAIEQTFPGIIAAFMFTDEQKQKLQEARRETIGTDTLVELARNAKQPATNEADRQKAADLMEKARAELAKKVAAILTDEQKSLAEKLNAAAQQAQEETRAALSEQFVSAKGNPGLKQQLDQQMREMVLTAFHAKATGILTADQTAAYQKAAEEHKTTTVNKPKK